MIHEEIVLMAKRTFGDSSMSQYAKKSFIRCDPHTYGRNRKRPAGTPQGACANETESDVTQPALSWAAR